MFAYGFTVAQAGLDIIGDLLSRWLQAIQEPF